MRSMLLTFAVFGIVLGFTAGPALAQDAAKDSIPAEAAPAPAKNDNPHVAIMTEKAKKLAKGMSNEEAEALGRIRDNFGIIRSIGIARKSVENAVGQCAEKNPELGEEITARFEKWDQGIGDAITKQEKNLDAAVSKKNFSNPDEVQSYLDSIDDMASYADEKIEKQIITTPEACKNLMGSMDETSKVILGLITELPWPSQDGAVAKDTGKAATP